MTERRACAVVGADRTSMRYRSYRSDDGHLRSRLRELAQQCRRFRVLNIVDDVTRECLRAVVKTSIPGRRVIRELTDPIVERGARLVRRCLH